MKIGPVKIGPVNVVAVNVVAVKVDAAKVDAAPRPTGEPTTRNQKPSSGFESQLAARLVDRLVDRGGVDPALRRASAASEVSMRVRSGQAQRAHIRPAVFGPFDAPRASASAWPSRVATAFTEVVTRARTAELPRSKDPLWGEFTSFLVVVTLIAVTFFV